MFNFLSRRSANRKLGAALYHRVAEAALSPKLFLTYRIEDSLSGRFESVALHMAVVLRHMRGWPDPAKDVASTLTDYYFTQLDDVLRELGTSDNKVPKKMKEMAGVFLAGAKECDDVLAHGDEAALRALLATRCGPDVDAPGLSRYVYGLDEALRNSSLEALTKEGAAFPVPPFPAGDSI